jgi:hypothetical protein
LKYEEKAGPDRGFIPLGGAKRDLSGSGPLKRHHQADKAHADLEAGSAVQMSIMSAGPIRTAPVHMIKLTAAQEIARYLWAHPEEDRR